MTYYYPFPMVFVFSFRLVGSFGSKSFLVCFVVHIVLCEDDIKAMYVHFSNNDAPLPCLALPCLYPTPIPAIIALQRSLQFCIVFVFHSSLQFHNNC